MKKNVLILLIVVLIFMSHLTAGVTEPTDIKDILEKYCIDCHGPDKSKGKLRVDELSFDVGGKDLQHWSDVLDQINTGEMPPPKKKQLSDEERRQLTDWLTTELKLVSLKKRKNNVVLRRLNREQYRNTLNDLLSLDVNWENKLPSDSKSPEGFINNGQTLLATSLHLDSYIKIAKQALDLAVVDPNNPPQIQKFKITFGKNILPELKGKRKGLGKGFGVNNYKIEELTASAPYKNYICPKSFTYNKFGSKILKGKNREFKGINHVYQANHGVVLMQKEVRRDDLKSDGFFLPPVHKPSFHNIIRLAPSPHVNVKMRVFPQSGRFKMRVKAYKKEAPNLVPYSELSYHALKKPKTNVPGDIILLGNSFVRGKKVTKNKYLVTEMDGSNRDPDKDSAEADYVFNVKNSGLYRVDMNYLNIISTRTPLTFVLNKKDDMSISVKHNKKMTRLPMMYCWLNKGENNLKIRTKAEIQIESFVFIQIDSETVESKVYFARKKATPYIRPFAGTQESRTQKASTFGEPQAVLNSKEKPSIYEFYGRIEDLPVPVGKKNDNYEANLMIIGVYNHQWAHMHGPGIVVQSIEFEGPYYDSWPPLSHKKIFIESPNSRDEQKYSREIITHFVNKTYRKSVSQEEVDSLCRYWQESRKTSNFYKSIKETLAGALCCPQFLYIDDKGAGEYGLANKLSYFLWNSMPDKELLELAQKNLLKKNLKPQIKRMLQDSRSHSFIESFTYQWLELDKLSLIPIVKDGFAYGEFLKEEAIEETYSFIKELVKNNLSVSNVIKSEFALLNQNMAVFYGIENVTGHEFKKVGFGWKYQRGGILTHSSILWANSSGVESHPIKRGVWFASRILDRPPPPPPANVPMIEPTDPKFKNLTIRKQLEVHRDNSACIDCHRKIDPWGLSFEMYDALGQVRTSIQDLRKYSAATTLPDGTDINSLNDLQGYIEEKRLDDVSRSLIRHMSSYALGRSLTFADKIEIQKIVDYSKKDGHKICTIIEQIVLSKLFIEENS